MYIFRYKVEAYSDENENETNIYQELYLLTATKRQWNI